MKEVHFDVRGMSCAACSARVEKAAESVAGTEGVAVNLLKNSMVCSVDDTKADTLPNIVTAKAFAQTAANSMPLAHQGQ